MPSLDVAFSSPTALVLLLLILAGGLATIFYRRTLPAVPFRRRLLLGILRGILLAFLLLALCEPLARLVTVTRHEPSALILLDNSASTAIADRLGSRAAVMEKFLRDVLPAVLPRSLHPVFVTFGAASAPPEERTPDSLDHKDEVTDIASALRALGPEQERLNIAAVLLVTDGVATLGENPVHQAAAPGVPVFTIGVGDTAAQRDLLVARVTANELVYAGTTVPVDVFLRESGYAGRTVEVTLADEKSVLARERVTLPSGGESTVQLSYVPEAEGMHRFVASVSPLEDELTTANNRRAFTVRVLKSKLRLLLIAGEPGPDLPFVRQALGEDGRFSLHVLTQKQESGFYEGSLSSAEIDSADCLITIGMPTSATTAATMRTIAGAIRDRQKPLLLIGGKAVDTGRLLAMAPSLPVTPGPLSPLEQEVEMVIPPGAKSHPLLTTDPATGSAPWEELPPVYATLTPFTLREGAVTLGVPRVHGVTLPQPLMAMRSTGEARALAMMGYGIWRWRLMAQGRPGTRALLPGFLSGAVMWLASRDEGKAVRVRPTRNEFSRGEKMAFTGQVYAPGGQPVENARVRLTVTGGGELLQQELRSVGNGRYEGFVEGLPQGTYAYGARAEKDGFALGDDRGTFAVGGLNLEFQETRMDAGVLRQIAYRSGGFYCAAADARALLPRALDTLRTAAVREERHVRTIELAHWQVLVPVLLLLLAAEWIVRRRNGML
jgi:hypothetical protein